MQARTILSRLFVYVRPQFGKFAGAILAMAVVAATEPAVAAMMKPLIDGTFINKDPDAILFVPLALVGLFLIRGAARVGSSLALTSVATRVVMQLRCDLFGQIQQLPQSFMDQNATGKLLSKVTYDVDQLSATASQVWLVLIRDSLIVVGLLGYMLYTSWQLSMFMFAAVPVIAVIIKAVSGRMRKSSRALQQGMGRLTHHLEESIKGHKLIKLYGAEAQEQHKFHGVADDLRQNTLRLTVIGAANSPVVQFVISIALACVVYFAANLEGEAAMSPGEFVSFFGAMGMLFAPVRALTSVNEQLQKGLAAAESVFQLMDETREVEGNGAHQPVPSKGHLQVRNLSFSYTNTDHPVLKNLNVEIQPGETVALVGPSGSGKSTLIQLLPRFYDPQRGEILLDGVNIRDLPLARLREQIAYVDQETLLFDESVAHNVALGDPQGPDPVRVREALRLANAESFVADLEHGIDTSIGEQGSLLSGGQRQRLALARAFYKQAPLLILDEATSALDSESERQVQLALEQLCQGRTTLIIAHRLSTIEKADRILVVADGEIRESGTHQELLARQGLYAQLYHQLH